MRTTGVMAGAAIAVAALFPAQAFAAEEHGLPGASMSLWWALPFAGLLLSIATGPLLFHHVWEHHYGKITALWSALVVVPLVAADGALAGLYMDRNTAQRFHGAITCIEVSYGKAKCQGRPPARAG